MSARREQIPVASHITLVCDAYHAMVSDRPYRKALPSEEARRRLREGAGSQFCPTATDAFLSIFGPEPTEGSAGP
jgi:HD-GYP domain-containing protein (c-di-GMP phosphodiesterase class II)